jgi:trigger factor
MTITRENTGDMTATVMIAINQQDYEEKVTKILKDYQHKANIPGFRPGKVPFGMIKKMYGKAVVADEVNKLLSESITQYIQDEKLDILGNPIANLEKNNSFDFDTQKDFEFYFDLGLAPVFELDLASLPATEKYNITIDDTMVDHYITDTRKRFGNPVHPEEAGIDDMLDGEIVEIDAEGTPVKEGITAKVFIEISKLQKDSSKELVTGMKKDAKFVIRPMEFFANKEEASKFLKITEKQILTEGIAFEFTVNDIHRTEPAELNKEFFKKVYPGKDFETEEEFRAKVREEASASFSPETDKLFFRQVSDKLISQTKIPLPDEFLKRWLGDHKDNKLTAEEIEKQYGSFSESMRWQLIENKLFKDNEITVVEEDIRKYIKNYFLSQIPMNLEDPDADTRMDSLVDTVMKNTEQVRKINDELYTNKLLGLFKSTLTIEEKEISFEEFAKFVSAFDTHEHHQEHGEHDHEHNHDHESDHDHHHNH